MLKKALGWIFVTDGLRVARGRFRDEEARRGTALQQARLLSEMASRIAEPAEPLPPGDRVPVILRLLREGVALALSAARPAGEAPAPEEPAASEGAAPAAAPARAPAAPELEAAWAAAPEAVLRDAVEDPADLAAVKETLSPTAAAPGAPRGPEHEDVVRARAFLDRLLWNADAPRRRVEALLIQRWLRVLALLVVVAGLGWGVRTVARGKNVLEGKPFTTSSSWSGCSTDPMCDGVLLFHTNNENQPWVIFDLQKPTTLHEIDVTNRTDCCSERTIPLVALLSTDRQHWKEVGRRTEPFTSWTVKFPPTTARYVKLMVDRVSTLHLKAVEAR